jgi:hypothetical protein
MAPQSAKLMREVLDGMKNMNVLDSEVSISSSMREEDGDAMSDLADAIIESMNK